MSGADLAAVVITISSVVAFVILGIALWAVVRTLRQLNTAVEELRVEATPAVAELRATMHRASDELDRVDGLLDTAEDVANRVEGASRVAYVAVSNPLIKALAIVAGIRGGSRRFRKNRV